MAKPTDEARLAVLIDADNAGAQHLERLHVEIAKYGTATVRRAHGDWTSTQLAKLLSEAVETAADDDGWAQLGAVGSNLSRLASDFDSRSWGFSKLTDLMVAHPGYDVESRKAGQGKPPNAFVRRASRK